MTLAETQFNIRRFLFFAVLLTVVYYIGQFVINGGFSIYQALFPKTPPAPESKFGKMPKLKMYPLNPKVDGTPQYSIEIPQSEIPNFPDRIQIYKNITPSPKFGAEDKVKSLATYFKFQTDPIKPSPSQYSWADGNTGRALKADTLYRTFSLDIKFDNLLNTTSNSAMVLNNDAKDKALKFISSQDLIGVTDQGNLSTTVIPTNLSPGKLRESKIYQDRAQLVKVNIFRSFKVPKPGTNPKDPEYNTYPILGPSPRESLINVYVSGAPEPLDIPIANFTYWETDYNEKSQYPLSPMSAVWNTITQGNGVISYLKLDDMDYYDSPRKLSVARIDIKKIYLAYYEDKDFSPYLQPMYVFEGKFTTNTSATETISKSGDIIIYYPAVRGDYVE